MTHRLLTFFLSLRAIMLIGSVGTIIGSLLMFLQGGFYLHEAWHTLMAGGSAAERQVTAPVLEVVDAFLFGIVLVIFASASPSASSSRCQKTTAHGCRSGWMKVGGVGQVKATLAEVVIVVLIVIFARIVVEANVICSGRCWCCRLRSC